MKRARNRIAGNTMFMRFVSPAHVIRPLLWVVLSRSLHVKALEFAPFVVSVWENMKVLKIERCLHVKMLDSAPSLLPFDRERMQLVYGVILLSTSLRNHLLSENIHWNYASLNVTLNYLMHQIMIFCVTSSLALDIWELKYCQTLSNKPNSSHRVLQGRLFSKGKI